MILKPRDQLDDFLGVCLDLLVFYCCDQLRYLVRRYTARLTRGTLARTSLLADKISSNNVVFNQRSSKPPNSEQHRRFPPTFVIRRGFTHALARMCLGRVVNFYHSPH
jgi:hypothetical protein